MGCLNSGETLRGLSGNGVVSTMRQLMLLLLGVGVACGSAGWLAARYGAAISSNATVTSHMPFPEDGKVQGGTYVNDYFGLSFSLPEGWTEGEPGPGPSDAGYYVLTSLLPKSELNATILIAAQDMFFAPGSHGDMAEVVHNFRQAMSEIDGMTIDRGPSEVKIADRLLHRVDFSGAGLYRATFTTEIRCHAVSFNLTARSPELLADLASSIDKLSSAGKSKADIPLCIENYATPENLLSRVEPTAVGPKFTPIPVRFVVDAQGGVKEIHVIHANPEQRKSVEEAVRQWKFKPYQRNGHVVDVETGLVFRFTPAGS
jgi:hypothetical protein